MAEARSTNEKGGDGERSRGEMVETLEEGVTTISSLVDVHFSGTYRFFGGRNETLFAVEGMMFSSRDRKIGNDVFFFLLFERGFLLRWINKLGCLFLLIVWKLCVFLTGIKISMIEMLKYLIFV